MPTSAPVIIRSQKLSVPIASPPPRKPSPDRSSTMWVSPSIRIGSSSRPPIFSEIGRMGRVGYKFDRWLGTVMLQKSLK